MSLDPFSRGGSDPLNPFGFSWPSRGGGIAKRPAPAETPEPLDIPAEVAPETEAKPKRAILRNPKWETESVGFNEDAAISAELELPDDIAHKTRVSFELFAKTPKGPERISGGEAAAQQGKAVCRIPVYIPTYLGADGNRMQEVEYWFKAKHSEAETLDGSACPKRVVELADPFIDSHILPDITFATGSSFLHPRQADGLKALCCRIESWRREHPEGKLAVFGHADAVGREAENKALSERRAKSVYAFLMKDVDAWEGLYGRESWGLAAVQEYLQYLGHEPGGIDGRDGPKTLAAVKEFQAKQGLPRNGVADAASRKALFQAFIAGINTLSLQGNAFDDIGGGATAGCSEFNLAKQTAGACGDNRRVSVFLLKATRNFPIHYPCAQGDVGPCRRQVARKGERRTPGFGCAFYDKLVVENGNAAATGVPICLESSDGHRLPDVAFIARFPDGTKQEGRLDAEGLGHVQAPPGAAFDLEYPELDDIRAKALSVRLARALDAGDAQRIAGALSVPAPVFEAMQEIISRFFPRPGDLIAEIRGKTKESEYGLMAAYCLAGLGVPGAEDGAPSELIAYAEPVLADGDARVALV